MHVGINIDFFYLDGLTTSEQNFEWCRAFNVPNIPRGSCPLVSYVNKSWRDWIEFNGRQPCYYFGCSVESIPGSSKYDPYLLVQE
jgi:hypothetical protein